MRTYHYIFAMAPRDGTEPIQFVSHELQAETLLNAYKAGQAHVFGVLQIEVPDGWVANDYVVADGLTVTDRLEAEQAAPPRLRERITQHPGYVGYRERKL
jgi:hypothetical protein